MCGHPEEETHRALGRATRQVKLPSTRIANEKKLRLGYLSYDFRTHPMGQLTVRLFEDHNRSCFHAFALSYGPNDASEWRRRIEAASDGFLDMETLGDYDAAKAAAELNIDIVIDLMVHTRGSR